MFPFGCFVPLLFTPLTHHISSCFGIRFILSAFHRRYSSSLSKCGLLFATAIAFPYFRNIYLMHGNSRIAIHCQRGPYSLLCSIQQPNRRCMQRIKSIYIHILNGIIETNVFNKNNCKFMHIRKSSSITKRMRE